MDHCFGKRYRLLKTDDFSSVFALRCQKSRAWLHVLRATNTVGHARLGLVVGKKVAKRANRRNYMKRVLREWFRCHKEQLPAEDFIIRVRQSFNRADCARVWQLLEEMVVKH